MELQSPPLLGFCAFSGTGKTTLLTHLIPELKGRGLRIGLVKHAHHLFDIDRPGKDSFELRKAGANEILVASAKRWAMVHESPEKTGDPVLEDLLLHLSLSELDLVLVEGFKHEALAKIEVHRPSLGKPFLFPDVPGVIAFATDKLPDKTVPLPVLDLNKIDEIANFIIKRFLKNI
ncbi:MAG: molybdopterin-guanine dinucleotide biosynthesis protein B [SAR324 cluster bacterium]|nr:molybdopterin-guanine dinucleotide biosynthesis protein B [SAR324 cluster bacterium]MBL7034837.1 molybdopterin-guanine dinucleotide biosynthesis protein B [SAR324 cluster bacterium]